MHFSAVTAGSRRRLRRAQRAAEETMPAVPVPSTSRGGLVTTLIVALLGPVAMVALAGAVILVRDALGGCSARRRFAGLRRPQRARSAHPAAARRGRTALAR
jgi:hypothetical protein